MNGPIELSLEQQFILQSFKMQANQMSLEQARDFLVKLYEQMLVRDVMYRQMLAHRWGIGDTANANDDAWLSDGNSEEF